ncbi:MAG: phosphoribosylanthranilate isomerase [Rhodothalassiaceae bacterium]
MAISVKICGLSGRKALEAAIAGGADMLGFVCFPRSPRHLEPDRLAALTREVRGRAERVGVLVDPDDALVRAIAPACDWLQLHGNESPERTAEIARLSGRRILKAVQVAVADDIAAARVYEAVADGLLFDARPAPEDRLPGGNGRAFDWTLLRGKEFSVPWWLSGGLDTRTLRVAVMASGAQRVDVSSGVEEGPGKKSLDKIAAFLEEARRISA